MFYKSGNSFKNIMALLVAFGFWIMVIINAAQEWGNGTSVFFLYTSVFFLIFMPVVGQFVTNYWFKKIVLYSNGIRIKYFLPTIFESNKIVSYDEVICFDFHEQTIYESNDGIQIIYIDNGKIKTISFSVDLDYNQVLKIADLIVAKKNSRKTQCLCSLQKNY